MKATAAAASQERVTVAPFPPYRHLLRDYLGFAAGKRNIHLFASYDMAELEGFRERCREAGQQPPSRVAYMARCLGVVLPSHPELLTVRHGGTLRTHRDVNLMMTVAASTPDGQELPLLLPLQRLQEKDLSQVAAEMAEGAQKLRTAPPVSPRTLRAASRFARSPDWLRGGVYGLLRRLPGPGRGLADYYANVGLTSVTRAAGGRGQWLLPMLPYSLSIALGGLSRRPVVVGDVVLPRPCLDVTLSFDHAVIDGVPAAQFVAALGEEVESGRVLAEYRPAGDAVPGV